MHRLGGALVTLCMAAAGCGGQQPSGTAVPTGPTQIATGPPAPAARDTTPPVFSVPLVDLDGVVQFIPFGVLLNPASGQKNPAYELLTRDPDAPVRAVTAGTVVEILVNPARQGDEEIHVRPTPNSIFLIIYDHVRDRTVSIGSPVSAGMVLGKVGLAGSYGRTELQVNRAEPPPEISVCPREYGTAEFNAAHDAVAARAGGTWGTVVCTEQTVVP